MEDERKIAFEELYQIIVTLRSPSGCPWDRKQNPETLRSSLLEEAYECIEAINEKNPEHVKEELGDLYLLVTMISYMYQQEEKFNMEDVLQGISQKLIRRHPHVFGEDNKDITSDEVLTQWDQIKEKVENRPKKDSILDEVPSHLPVLERAWKLQKKAAKKGFDWEQTEPVWGKIHEEIDELRMEIENGDQKKAEGELGDLLFSVVNLARQLKIEPAMALLQTNNKFEKRFKHIEKKMKSDKIIMSQGNLEIMDRLWEESKSLDG